MIPTLLLKRILVVIFFIIIILRYIPVQRLLNLGLSMRSTPIRLRRATRDCQKEASGDL
ncbi:hypothetical protein H1R20_g4151, partial [Candolleomyces eurysporus]